VKTYELTDVQWKLVKPVFDPKVRRGPKTRHSRRRLVEAVLWLARTGCRWWPGRRRRGAHDARASRELLDDVLPPRLSRVSAVMADRGYRSLAHRLA
jgi:transposase